MNESVDLLLSLERQVAVICVKPKIIFLCEYEMNRDFFKGIVEIVT